jgi:hypothetical protein
METNGGVKVQLHAFQLRHYRELDVQLHALATLLPRERTHSTNFVQGQVGPTAGFDAVKRRISFPCQEYNPDSPEVQPEDMSRLRLDEGNYLNLEFRKLIHPDCEN